MVPAGLEVAEEGLGIPKFIAHSELGLDASKDVEYLRRDCLRLRVAGVEVR